MTSRLSSNLTSFLSAERQAADDAGDGADVDRRHAADEAGARGDGHQAGHRAGGGAEGRGLALLELLDQRASRAWPPRRRGTCS